MIKTPLFLSARAATACRVALTQVSTHKQIVLIICAAALLNGCAVVTTAAVVGGVALSATTTALDLTYETSKAVATGTYAAGEFAVEALAKPDPAETE
ncbi:MULTISPECIES: hypothetical protein [Deefgea]|uniref:Lipoprotein n=1 Tax=Deefgea chitinilytica TaxID=570276 RepID=A0ABS2CD37_9NEIS|nr:MULTISPECIES: hypothetical protein [Deefgea]MBM5571957.1 hypothetical protein [Deefgea chitinilytica]MBM9889192.1 hypothetical protein [Deefgea sp. CFH1-16]